MCNTVAISLRNGYETFDQIEDKHDKKNLMRAHVWLDALITLNRIRPAAIDKSITELQEKFKHFEPALIEALLQKYCQMQARKDQVKFVKTKDC